MGERNKNWEEQEKTVTALFEIQGTRVNKKGVFQGKRKEKKQTPHTLGLCLATNHEYEEQGE